MTVRSAVSVLLSVLPKFKYVITVSCLQSYFVRNYRTKKKKKNMEDSRVELISVKVIFLIISKYPLISEPGTSRDGERCEKMMVNNYFWIHKLNISMVRIGRF